MAKKAGNHPKLNKKASLLLLAVLVCVSVLGGFAVRAALESDKSTGVRSVHVKDSEIENSTLVIGSHLIHISALTDQLYEIAQESANEFNQSQVYYKSELADGTWFEISEASSIADITQSGSPVSRSVIEGLEFTHQTKSDGITIDLRTGQAVSIFNINNPYDLRTMEELEPLRIQYQILQEKTDKNESDQIYLQMVQSFFEKDIQDDATRDYDSSMQSLESYKNGLSSREKPSQWSEKTGEILTSIDAYRRVEALTNLEGFLDTLENDASGMGASNQKESADGEESVPPDFVVNSDIVSAVGDCIQNVQESISSYEAKKITDTGDTVAAQTEYRYSQELISLARAQDTPGCDKIMESLCNLQNILNGVVANQESELDTLTSDLVSGAFNKYTADLRAGVSTDYQTAVAEGSSQAVLQKYLTEQKTAANADRMEYQTMLEAQFSRMENQAAQAYVLKLIDGVPQLEDTVVQDAAESYLLDTVADHLIWLRSSYADLVKNASDSTDMFKLEQEKEELSKQRQDALDNNNLAEANKLTAQMEAKQKEIDSLADSLNAIMNSPNSSESDKAKAAAAMGENTTSALLSSMADVLTSDIRNAGEDTSTTDLQNQMAALTAAATLDPEAAQAALNQVQDALDNATGLDTDTTSSLQSSLADAKETIAQATTGGGTLTGDELQDLLDSILNGILGSGGYDSASASQQTGAMLALEWYGEEKNSSAALNLAATLARQGVEEKNPYLYEKYSDSSEAYLSLQTLAKVLGYRYIFDDANSTVTLQKSKSYYLFTLAKQQCEREGSVTKELSTPPQLSGTMYILGTDSESLFDTRAEYFRNALYGAAGTPAVESLAQQIYEQLLEGGA